MKLTVIVVGLIVLQGCAVASLGRMHPLLPAETEGLDCDGLADEVRKTDDFCALSLDSKGYGKRDVAATMFLGAWAFLTPAPYNNIELIRAIKSASIRQVQLTHEMEAAGCPVIEREPACPPLCSRPAVLATLTMENGFLGERCVVLNVQERKTYAHLLDG